MSIVSPIVGVLIVIAAGAIMLGVFAERTREMPHEGVALANRQLVTYRHGFNAWIVLAEPNPEEVPVGNQSYAEVQAELFIAKQSDASWGGRDYWLHLPECRISLWWVVAICLASILFFARRPRHQGQDFP